MEKKYLVLKCTQQLYNKIKNIFINVGYKEVDMNIFNDSEYLIINYQNNLG